MGDLPGGVFLYDIQGVIPDGRPTLHRSKPISLRSTPKVNRLILKIDGDGTVLAYRLGGLSHLSPPLRWSLALMRHHGGNVLTYRECCEKRRGFRDYSLFTGFWCGSRGVFVV